jgi:hypothetical protein
MSNRFSHAVKGIEDEKRSWTPILIGLITVVAVIFVIVIASRTGPRVGFQQNPYADNLKLSDVKLSAAENYVGGTVTYLDLNITNSGKQSLTGAQMHAIFKNSMGQVVQTETLPLHVLVENQMAGYPDLVDLSRNPIGPSQTKTVRMTLEHISDDWDHNTPEMELVNLKLKLK